MKGSKKMPYANYTKLYGKPEKFKEGHTIRGVPCFLCNKSHARIIAHHNQDGGWGWIIRSPCAETISRKVVGAFNKVLEKQVKERR